MDRQADRQTHYTCFYYVRFIKKTFRIVFKRKRQENMTKIPLFKNELLYLTRHNERIIKNSNIDRNIFKLKTQ